MSACYGQIRPGRPNAHPAAEGSCGIIAATISPVGVWSAESGITKEGRTEEAPGMTQASDKPAVPERYAMPDLSGLLPKSSVNLILRALTGEEPVTTISGRPLWVNFVRLTDKA